METQEATDAPPPYSPPEYPDPPPYSPGDATGKDDPQPVNAHAQHATYGTSPKTDGEQSPPGAPPYCTVDPNPQALTTSTTLLVTRERKPPTFFILSLITCLCFSPLFGLMALIFSALSDSAWNAGDSNAARRYSQVAISLSVVGVVITILAIIIVIATGAIQLHL